MNLYIERTKNTITLQEWLDYVRTDESLILAEVSEGINPLTKLKLRIEIPGRVIFDDAEICYKKGRIGCEYYSENIADKLKEIAATLHAEVFDCGEKIY